MQSSEQFILFVLTFSLKTFHVDTNIVDKKIVVHILQCLLALTKIRFTNLYRCTNWLSIRYI